MAGHSQFKNIMFRKGAQDKKRGKVFTKLIRELTTAARMGLPDPAANPRLRAAVLAARQANMPKDTVERAIKRGAGAEAGEAYEEVRYEGYGPGGVAVIVEALTDNRNRTASDVRAAFTKSSGALGETNCVSFMFDRVGEIVYPADAASADDMLEAGDRGRRQRCRKRRRAPRRAVPRRGFQRRCATRWSSASATAESAKLDVAAEDHLAGRRRHRDDPLQAARNPRRQRRRAERLRQFRGGRRRPGAAERVMGERCHPLSRLRERVAMRADR